MAGCDLTPTSSCCSGKGCSAGAFDEDALYQIVNVKREAQGTQYISSVHLLYQKGHHDISLGVDVRYTLALQESGSNTQQKRRPVNLQKL